LSLFHALGKFLYNKRLTSGKPEALPFKELSKKKKPKFYMDHAEVLHLSQQEPTHAQLYLH
jgi:hypothetical protein